MKTLPIAFEPNNENWETCLTRGILPPEVSEVPQGVEGEDQKRDSEVSRAIGLLKQKFSGTIR